MRDIKGAASIFGIAKLAAKIELNSWVPIRI
jgi:hypothetical protein